MEKASICEDVEAATPAAEEEKSVETDAAAEAVDEPALKRLKFVPAAIAPATVFDEVVSEQPASLQSAGTEGQDEPQVKRRRFRKKGPHPEVLPVSQPPPPAPPVSCTGGPSRKGLPVVDATVPWQPASALRGGGELSGFPPEQLQTVESTGTSTKERTLGEDRETLPLSRPQCPG